MRSNNPYLWEDIDFSDNENKPTFPVSGGDYFFTSCTFVDLSSDDSGEAISFTSGDSLSIDHCTFQECSTTGTANNYYGGGAVYVHSGTLSISHSIFVSCTTSIYGGGVYADLDCTSSSVLSSSFIECEAKYGGGLMTFFGPSSFLSQSCFVSCKSTHAGGGMYHDGTEYDHIKVTGTLFDNNSADTIDTNSIDYGGGGLKDYKTKEYTSKYSFSFFTRNSAKKGFGHDIAINTSSLQEGTIAHCYTTTAQNSYNGGAAEDDWLPQTNSSTNFRAAKS